MDEFDEPIDNFREPGPFDFIDDPIENRMQRPLIVMNHGESQLRALPEILSAGFRAGDRKALPAAAQDFSDHAALFLEAERRMQQQFQS